jgi:ATP-dependent DNA helicase RecG
MERNLLDNKIEYLKGVGPKRAELLNKELDIYTFGDLLFHFPFRYIDKSQVHKISEINSDQVYYQLIGKVTQMQSHGKQRVTRISANFTDESGSIELVWFKGLKWIKTRFEPDKKYVLFGKASVFNNQFNFVHPDIEDYQPDVIPVGESLEGVYSTTEKLKNNGLGSKQLAKLIKNLLSQLSQTIPENLPKSMLEKHRLMGRNQALHQIHLPRNQKDIQAATLRLKFEEYFFMQLNMLLRKRKREAFSKGVVFQKVGNLVNLFYKHYLPFSLTNAQKKVIREIRHDLGSGHQMNRLLQGDVGSGKTIVALMAMLIALDNGYQAALMAPTEILAVQHYHSLKELLSDMPVKIALLTGSTKARDRKPIHESLEDGSLQIIIGTHALIEEKVKFKHLALTIIDEQHRFGVAQRARFWEKTTTPPHMLVMTATPIPRTLAMTQYGDLDISVIDELPPGRKPVKTIHLYHSQRLRLISFMKKQIAEGRQIYIVYPLIKESEKLDLIYLQEGYESLLRDFPEPHYRICVVHGQMKAEDKEFEMQRFVKGQAHIMVATTVIEVGVNIPNASVMVIEHADRFGLSQLHQLRGRVGRGADQSYCILMTDFKLSADGRKRMSTMVRTTDGFEIAAVDLELRGPGETQGTRQSGPVGLKIGNLIKDEKLIKHVRAMVNQMLDDDPHLLKPENQNTKAFFISQFRQSFDWGQIG